ncbi:RluA family pseudouridine synthase [Eubacterium ramulus]|jgi:23S rRNA pseudouridine1911/1915/1917 synthase|nr:RluA family pseudouridine synthase [Roseburia sp. OM02-15]
MSDAMLEEYTVEESQSGMRLDKFLTEIYPDQTRSFLQKLVKSGEIKVNGKPVIKAGFVVEGGDQVSASIPTPQAVEIEAENIPLDILYEDADVLIVNKPKGMVVHPSAGHYSGTLVNAIMYHCADSLSGINGEIRPGIVHRIDMDTTGALIICKNDAAHVDIAEQIKEHTVTRRYRGIVCGVVKEDEGTIEGAIGRHPTQRKKMAINEKNGKPAITHYKVLQRFAKYTYMEFRLETGRTHQIRVHMASIGHPLLGDELYGNPKNLAMKGLQGQTLHAMVIGFVHPTTHEYMEFEAPLPEYFQNLLQKLPKQ